MMPSDKKYSNLINAIETLTILLKDYKDKTIRILIIIVNKLNFEINQNSEMIKKFIPLLLKLANETLDHAEIKEISQEGKEWAELLTQKNEKFQGRFRY